MKVAQSCLILCNPIDYMIHAILQARILEWIAFHSPGVLPNPGIKPSSPALQADYLQTEGPGKSRNTEVSSLSFPQQILLIHESSWGLLHCRWILYQLSYQGSPIFIIKAAYSVAHEDMLLVEISLKVTVSALISTYIQISPL